MRHRFVAPGIGPSRPAVVRDSAVGGHARTRKHDCGAPCVVEELAQPPHRTLPPLRSCRSARWSLGGYISRCGGGVTVGASIRVVPAVLIFVSVASAKEEGLHQNKEGITSRAVYVACVPVVWSNGAIYRLGVL